MEEMERKQGSSLDLPHDDHSGCHGDDFVDHANDDHNHDDDDDDDNIMIMKFTTPTLFLAFFLIFKQALLTFKHDKACKIFYILEANPQSDGLYSTRANACGKVS